MPVTLGGRMSGKDLVLRVVVPAILLIYVAPVVVMAFDTTRMWLADLGGHIFKAGPISLAFMSLVGPTNGPYTLLHKGIGVLGTSAIVATLWSAEDRVLDVLMLFLIGAGLLAALMVWWMLESPNLVLEVQQAANLPEIPDSKAFGALRDKLFSDEITALLSFGVVLTGVKLKGEG